MVAKSIVHFKTGLSSLHGPRAPSIPATLPVYATHRGARSRIAASKLIV
jgi:hypothetical protein